MMKKNGIIKIQIYRIYKILIEEIVYKEQSNEKPKVFKGFPSASTDYTLRGSFN
jgi:hypothetical protein